MNSIGKILQDRRKELGLTQPDVNKELKQFGYSMNHAAISSWERNVTQPNATQFLALCKILGITNIYDAFIGEYTPDNPFSELNEEGIQKAKEYIDLLIKSGDYTKEDTSVLPSYREIRLFDLPASAGTGEFLDSDNFDMIEVGNEVAPEADFGIRIHGDSMEPSISTDRSFGYSRRKNWNQERSASSISMATPTVKNWIAAEREPSLSP